MKGITNQLREDDMLRSGCFGMQVPDDDAEVLRATYGPEQGYTGKFKDDITGQVLRDEWVHEARAVELAFFSAKGVWKKVPKAAAHAATGRRPGDDKGALDRRMGENRSTGCGPGGCRKR